MHTYLMGKPVRESFLGSAPGAELSRQTDAAFAGHEQAVLSWLEDRHPSPTDRVCAGLAPVVLSTALQPVAAPAATGAWAGAGRIPWLGLVGVQLTAPGAASQTPRGLTTAEQGRASGDQMASNSLHPSVTGERKKTSFLENLISSN